MSSAQFSPSELDTDALPADRLLPDTGLGPSLMARAQRGSLLQRQLVGEATRLAADVATSSYPQARAQNALLQQRLELQAREHAAQREAALRADFDPGQFTVRVEAIRDLADSTAQSGAIATLHADYARYRTVPALARQMDEQLDALKPAIAARQESRLHERISANRFALTPEDAAKKFFGYRITPTLLPPGVTPEGGQRHRLVYIA